MGGAVIFLGVSIGYAAGTTNPYTIAIAQDIAEVPLYSGMGFRWVIFAVTEAIAILYVMAYARKVKRTPRSPFCTAAIWTASRPAPLMSCRPPR